MEEKVTGTIYLDQNIISHLREGQPVKEELLRVLGAIQEQGIIYVYSDVHVEECRAFANPEQYVEVLDALDAYYLQPVERLGQHREATTHMADDLILSETDFANKSLELLNNTMVLIQYGLGWLSEVEAEELMQELKADVEWWAEECERETLGFISASSVREQLLGSLFSLDLEKLKREGIEQQPKTDREWNHRFGKLDKLGPEDVVEFLFSENDHQAAQQLRSMFPKRAWPNGAYKERGALTGLSFFLFTQGVGRDSKVKKGRQSNRRKRFQAQYRDCRHIEEAAGCDIFLSLDAGAIKLAQAAYAYAGVRTIANRIAIRPN